MNSPRLLKRTKAGAIPAADLKAIQWYMIKNGLEPMATNAYPVFSFRDRKGNEITMHLGDILDEYDAFKERAHGRKSQSAA